MKILLIADVHGNATALQTVLAKECDADTTVFLGDAAFGGPQPNETIELLRSIPGTFILGNHDVEMLEPERLSQWPEEWMALVNWTLDTLTPADYDFLRALQPEGEYEVGGMRLLLHHGVLSDEPRQALPDTSDERLSTLANGSDCPLVLFGHSHVQFDRIIGGQHYINPGSVGQSRCGQRLACYGVFEDGNYEHRQVQYDPSPWLDALDAIRPLDAFPDFVAWLKKGFLSGYGIGEKDPWTRYAQEGFR